VRGVHCARQVLTAAFLSLGCGLALPAPTSPPPCRVSARLLPSPLPWLSTIEVALRPGCPPGQRTQVRLASTFGSTDPPGGWRTLTPCDLASDRCRTEWRGVLLRPLNWRPQWRAASGRPYDIPIQSP
jgi:hypothetical protein